jgi:hypothetical protein
VNRKTPLGAVAGVCAILAHAPKIAAHEARDPGSATALAAHKAEDAEGTAITSTGFHVLEDGTSRLTVQLKGSVPVEAHVTGAKAEYVLVGASIPSRNNRNPLITKEFVSLVTSVRLVPEYADEGTPAPSKKHKHKHKHHGKPTGVRLVVDMREDAQPQHRLVTNTDGTAVLTIDFPKPKKAPAPAE